MVVDDINKGSKSSNDLENVYDGTQNVGITDSNYAGDDDDAVSQDDTLTLRFIEKSSGYLAGEKNINCKQSTEK